MTDAPSESFRRGQSDADRSKGVLRIIQVSGVPALRPWSPVYPEMVEEQTNSQVKIETFSPPLADLVDFSVLLEARLANMRGSVVSYVTKRVASRNAASSRLSFLAFGRACV